MPYGVDEKDWDSEKASSYISKNGLAIYDVNGENTLKFSWTSVQKQLTRKSGDAFGYLDHMGYIYSQNYPQYSQLTYQPISNGVVLNMAGWYRLTFVLEEKALRLSKLEYLEAEDE